MTAVVFSPDHRLLYTGGFDGTVRQWRADTGEAGRAPTKSRAWADEFSANHSQLVRVLEGHKDRVLTIATSAEGQYVYSAGADKDVCQWSTETGEVRVWHERTLAVMCQQLTTREHATQLTRLFTGHTDSVTSLAASRDGLFIYAGCKSGTVRGWPAESLEVRCQPSALFFLSTPRPHARHYVLQAVSDRGVPGSTVYRRSHSPRLGSTAGSPQTATASARSLPDLPDYSVLVRAHAPRPRARRYCEANTPQVHNVAHSDLVVGLRSTRPDGKPIIGKPKFSQFLGVCEILFKVRTRRRAVPLSARGTPPSRCLRARLRTLPPPQKSCFARPMPAATSALWATSCRTPWLSLPGTVSA